MIVTHKNRMIASRWTKPGDPFEPEIAARVLSRSINEIADRIVFINDGGNFVWHAGLGPYWVLFDGVNIFTYRDADFRERFAEVVAEVGGSLLPGNTTSRFRGNETSALMFHPPVDAVRTPFDCVLRASKEISP